MKYLLILFLALNFNLQACSNVVDKCGQTWTRTTKWFHSEKSLSKFLVKLKKQESVCGEWRSYEDIWFDEDSGERYVSYWTKAERDKWSL
jgi:hypothetical protein